MTNYIKAGNYNFAAAENQTSRISLAQSEDYDHTTTALPFCNQKLIKKVYFLGWVEGVKAVSRIAYSNKDPLFIVFLLQIWLICILVFFLIFYLECLLLFQIYIVLSKGKLYKYSIYYFQVR